MIKLKTPMILNPFGNYTGEAVVTGEFQVTNERGEVFYSKEKLPLNQKGRIEVYSYLYFVSEEEIQGRELEKSKKDKELAEQVILVERKIEEQQKRDIQLMQDFKNLYNIPFKQVARIKIVMSGLSENSMGDGSKRNSVMHLFVKEDFTDGKMKRLANTFLCSPNDAGKHFYLDDDSYEDIRVITCKKCLKIMERWKK